MACASVASISLLPGAYSPCRMARSISCCTTVVSELLCSIAMVGWNTAVM